MAEGDANMMADPVSKPRGFYPECECGQVGPLLDWKYLNWSYTCERCTRKAAFWNGVFGMLILRPLWDRNWRKR